MGIQAFFVEDGRAMFNARNKLIESFNSREAFKILLNKPKEEILDILAYFEGIQIYQNPNWYLNHFNKQFVKLRFFVGGG